MSRSLRPALLYIVFELLAPSSTHSCLAGMASHVVVVFLLLAGWGCFGHKGEGVVLRMLFANQKGSTNPKGLRISAMDGGGTKY